MEISYKNAQGTYVLISNDEELQAAFEVAGTEMKGHLDILVKPRLMVTTKDGEQFEIYPETNPQETKGGKREQKPKKEKEVTKAGQRRVFKKLIKKELNKECDQIFNDLFNASEYTEECKSGEPNLDWVPGLAQQVGNNVRSELQKNQSLIEALKTSLKDVDSAEKALKEQLKTAKAWKSLRTKNFAKFPFQWK